MLIGYARVSTLDQDLSNQISSLEAAGCAKVYAEKISGAKSDRKELSKALKKLKDGDVLVVTRLDRLARSTKDLLNILDSLGRRGVSFKSLGDSWLDTSTAHGKLILTVLGGLAEFERALIVARTTEGRNRALARGVRFGRPSKLNPHQRREALARVQAGEAQSDVARTYAVDPAVICRLVAASAV
jgi:DNA invertase Pin-like site-specific DNA recombinase